MRVEARKVHELFFDILKIAFPDTDFREARNALSFPGLGPVPAPASTPSPRPAAAGQGKRHKQINEVEPDPPPPPKQQPVRGPAAVTEDTRAKTLISQKESRLGSCSSSRDQDESPLPTHPGDLVISKKKRKDREKSATAKPRSGSSGPVSPPSMGRSIRSPGPGSIQKDGRSSTQQAWASQSAAQQANNGGGGGGGGGGVGWANPVKRMRTDTGKRRPSHL